MSGPTLSALPACGLGARQGQFIGLSAPTQIRRNGIVVADAAIGTFVDTGLTPETEYTYELQLVTGQEANDRFTRTFTVATVPLLDKVQGVTVTIVEPGIADVSWDPLEVQLNLSYRVYLNGELVWAPPFIDRKITARRIDVPVGETTAYKWRRAGTAGQASPTLPTTRSTTCPWCRAVASRRATP